MKLGFDKVKGERQPPEGHRPSTAAAAGKAKNKNKRERAHMHESHNYPFKQ